MATASPTPMGAGLVRRTSQRQALRRLPSRQAMNHQDSHHASSGASTSNNQHSQPPQFRHDDSSDDEMPVVMKLSALTKAILNDGAPEQPERPASPPRTRRRTSALNASTSSAAENRRHLRSGSVQAQAHDGKTSRPTSPAASRDASPVRRRVVRLSNTPQSLNQIKPSKRRSTSTSRSTQRSGPSSRPGSRDKSSDERHEPQSDINTPSHGGRVVRITNASSGNRSRLGSTGPSSGRSNMERSMIDKSAIEAEYEQQPEEPPSTINRNRPPSAQGSVSRYPSNGTRSRPEDNVNLQSSMRIKRVGKVSGSFLSGPARRGRRRQSEEDEVNGEGDAIVSSQEPENQPAEEPAPYYGDGIHNFNSGSPVSGNAAARAVHRRNASNLDLRMGSLRSSREPSPRIPTPQESTPEVASIRMPEPEPDQNDPEEIHYKLPVARPEMPSRRDQENDLLASYRRVKSSAEDLLEKAAKPVTNGDASALRTVSPERRPLASMPRNTPHRQVPPPPPKMSIIDAATTTAGAAAATTTQGKQRRNILRVNGKSYTRLDVLGRGGSAKVYRVTAENGTMLALKRVSLENIDETIFRGYMGEIDLLERLKNADRVINLMAHELNSEKKVLTLVMELGDLDMGSLIKSRTKSEDARFDPVFVRFYWKEMVECVRAIHEYDVVHSDLKPANFVLVKGTLKLIDFGIANAIQTDETINVHRDTNVGTPNYMSPESLMDSNSQGGRVPGRPKLVKLGKPSDVWSLGCILYQMVYGMAPFAHIATQFSRCQAIINWNHEIEFPSRGMGGAPVPPSLIRTMRRCLNRDQHLRPTCEELLYDSDPFLYPAELTDKALPIDEELLGRIIQSVVTRCRERMPTEAESLSVWPQAYWASVKKAMANRM
ncbi:kinase-like domain-containing protein [Mariannaea sp. PMI_226]|nr:kinase-like domain-containing protein [Mariannaea sp. PMI_226]